MTCPRCSLPGHHLLAGDCVKALKRRLSDVQGRCERLVLRAEAAEQATRAANRELATAKRQHEWECTMAARRLQAAQGRMAARDDRYRREKRQQAERNRAARQLQAAIRRFAA